jgi:hypothetical protein
MSTTHPDLAERRHGCGGGCRKRHRAALIRLPFETELSRRWRVC